jgi:isoleucyl-tRNA synthetase
MKFHIEIVRITDGVDSEVLHRSFVDEMSPLRAMIKASDLLDIWSDRGANGARILNHRSEELYSWKKS